VLTVILVICQVIAALGALYGLYFVIMAFPLRRLQRRPDPATVKVTRFAVVVFAKNEAAVIGQLLDSLRKQDYPPDAYDIFVVADNCTDDTAGVAAKAGAIVWEREDPAHIGKSYVQTWFFERFRTECAGRYDAAVIFDADNLVDPGFLAAMNRERNLGAEIAIGYRRSKNPSSSAVAGTTALFWLLQARLFHASRVQRGMPCLTVGGTGYMFDLAVLPDGRWQTYSLVEDIEFTLNSIAEGHSVTFTYDAVFYDEQPVKWSQSFKQRYRWSVGAFQMMKYALPHLVRTARKYGWRQADAIAYSFGALVQALSAIAGMAVTVLLAVRTGQWLLFGLISLGFAVVAYAAATIVARVTLALEGAWWRGANRAVLVFPIFVLTWTVLYVVAMFYRNLTWHPIPHTATVSLDQVTAQLSTARAS